MEPPNQPAQWLQWLRAIVAVLLFAMMFGAFLWLSFWLSNFAYGYAAFLLVPCLWTICLSSWAYRVYGKLSWLSIIELLTYQVGALMLVALVLMAIRFEGIICIAMAAPVVLLVSLITWAVIAILVRLTRIGSLLGRISVFSLAALVFLSGMERDRVSPAPLCAVNSEVLINAAPKLVWENVIAFSEIPAPTEWFFRAGIAYPVRAKIEGVGVGAVRHCEFNTGAFVEPIEIWDKPNRLGFTVKESPPPMTELNPFGETDPPHLHGLLNVERGHFELLPVAGGQQTLLKGTTWYRHALYPTTYWRMWSDYLIHRIHLRVLNHIKADAELPSK